MLRMIKYRYLIKIFLIFFFQKKEDFKDDIQCENWGLFQSGCSQLVGFQNATTPAFQFKGTKVKPHMSYASMLLKLQIIRALEKWIFLFGNQSRRSNTMQTRGFSKFLFCKKLNK